MQQFLDKNSKKFDYIKVLEAIDSFPFNVGKRLLIDFLIGNKENESIKRNRLHKKILFGILQLYSRIEIEDLIENLLHNKLINYIPLNNNKFVKVIGITEKGREEIRNPELYKKKLINNYKIKETEITEHDKKVFESFGFFLKPYNDEQKKAIVSPAGKILCVAGAGSGKTTVLTKRIEFLTTFRSVKPERILAITFTRKARTEMASRLSKSPYCHGVKIETFNSFCEKVLKQHNDLIYKRPARVISYREKIKLFRVALRENKIDVNSAIDSYFTFGQRRDKSNEELIKMFMNDCFSVLELFKTNNKKLEDIKENIEHLDEENKANVEMLCKICRYIDSFMKKFGLRDFSDQLVECIKFFRENRQHIPRFDHILIDEYQDVNSIQIELVDILDCGNIFCVGDPRQSIFGWRGSKIRYILNFANKYPDCEIITLSTNYRSSRQIVHFMNKSLENMNLPELRDFTKDKAEIRIINFDSEADEMEFVTAKILDLDVPRNEIFVLARTNRQLSELSQRLKLRNIMHIIKTEDFNREQEADKDEITLATVHSIKGMEADTVFVIGCSGINFPCKASDHPIIELIKLEDYDKEEEERRLFYVAISRAKRKLYLTYPGKSHTRFINNGMLEILGHRITRPELGLSHGYNSHYNSQKPKNTEMDVLSRLKIWRTDVARKLKLPAYMIMHDKTLMEIVSNRPSNLDELKEISGIGPAKLEKYGEEIIGILNN